MELVITIPLRGGKSSFVAIDDGWHVPRFLRIGRSCSGFTTEDVQHTFCFPARSCFQFDVFLPSALSDKKAHSALGRLWSALALNHSRTYSRNVRGNPLAPISHQGSEHQFLEVLNAVLA